MHGWEEHRMVWPYGNSMAVSPTIEHRFTIRSSKPTAESVLKRTENSLEEMFIHRVPISIARNC